MASGSCTVFTVTLVCPPDGARSIVPVLLTGVGRFHASSPFFLRGASRHKGSDSFNKRSKSLSNSLSCTMRYFWNSVSACSLACSCEILLGPVRISLPLNSKKPSSRLAQSAIDIGILRTACNSPKSR